MHSIKNYFTEIVSLNRDLQVSFTVHYDKCGYTYTYVLMYVAIHANRLQPIMLLLLPIMICCI